MSRPRVARLLPAVLLVLAAAVAGCGGEDDDDGGGGYRVPGAPVHGDGCLGEAGPVVAQGPGLPASLVPCQESERNYF